MPEEAVIRVEDVWVYYEGVPALEGVNLIVEAHDFLGIIGPNGGGKTTLLKVMLGLIKPDRGRVTILGKSPAQSRAYLGYIPQHTVFDRDFPISVWDTVLMGRYSRAGLLRRYRPADRAAAESALRAVGMYDLRQRPIGKLSGGQQQRAFIARALVSEPKVLLLDEPTASVDPTVQTEFYDLLAKLKHQIAIVLVSHDVGAVSVYVDKIACINHQLFYSGTKNISADTLETVYKCPIHLVSHWEHTGPGGS